MSALKNLNNSISGQMFHEEFTAKQAMHYNLPRMTKFLSNELNERLEDAIRDARFGTLPWIQFRHITIAKLRAHVS